MSKQIPFLRHRVLKQAMQWFVELQSEHCTEERKQHFQAWLTQDEQHRRAYQEAELLWSNMDTLKSAPQPDLATALTVKPRAALLTIAPVLLVSAVIVGGWLDYTAETLQFTTTVGQRRGIDLADGSHIELNADTRLSVRVSWLRRRIELVDGVAQFTVAHEVLRPFIVQAETMQIRDIGTVFTVRKHRQAVSVTVEQGEVAVKDDGFGWQEERVNAGYRRKLDSSGRLQAPEPVDIEQAAAWLNGVLVFDHSTLADAAVEFERYHAVRFRFVDPSIAEQTINGRFESGDLESFLKALKKMLPIQIKREKNQIVLSTR